MMISPHEFFAVLSDETRLRCLVLLQKEKEICVCEFSQVLKSQQPKISRHLSLLKKSGLVIDERRGQWIYYRLNERLERWKKDFLDCILETLHDTKPYQSDFENMLSIRNTNPCSLLSQC